MYNNYSNLIFVDGALGENNNNYEFLIKYPPVKEWLRHMINKIYFTEDKVEEILTSAYGVMPSEDEINGYLNPLLIEGTAETIINSMEIKDSLNISNLKTSDAQIFAIWGEEDTITPIEIMNDLKNSIEGIKTFVIQDASHCPMETHSEEFNIMLELILE
jgi:pimeloyl-ACP methyl ester carboxylesterase